MRSSAPRSYLFVPGNRPERFTKACSAGADAVIIDLEDAVPFSEKATARAALAAWLSSSQPVLVRINGTQSEWFRDDVELCRHPAVMGIVLPKAQEAEEIGFIAERIGMDKSILPLIETARGMWQALDLAQTPPVQRLLFGSIDFQLDLGIDGEGEELLYFRSRLVLVSRVAGIHSPVDGVCQTIDSPEALRADSLRAKHLGFGAKLCIHPKQVAQVNQCFSPTPEEVAWATKVMKAAAAAGDAAVAVDGKMVDRPIILKAQEILRMQSSGAL